jgi:TolB-like protein
MTQEPCFQAAGLTECSRSVASQDAAPTPVVLKPTVVTGTYLESSDAAGTLTVTTIELGEPIKRLDTGTDGSVLTQEGAMLGTPNYMSPELTLGKDVDSRSDMFSLGVVLYELAAGRNPFSGASFGETVIKILNHDPGPIRPWNPDVTPEFERIVRKCLEKDPKNRYATFGQLREELAKAHTDAGSFSLSKRTLLRVTAVGLVLCLLGAALAFLVKRTSVGEPPAVAEKPAAGPIQNSVTVLPFLALTAGETVARVAADTADALSDLLARVPGLHVPERMTTFASVGSSEGARWPEAGTKVATVLQGTISQAEETIQLTAKLCRTADNHPVWFDTFYCRREGLPAVRDEIARQVAETLKSESFLRLELRPAKHGTENAEARSLYLLGHDLWQQRSAKIKSAISNFTLATHKDPGYADPWAGLACAYGTSAAYGGLRATETFSLARNAARKALGLDPAHSDAFAAMGSIQAFFEYDWKGAEATFRKAIALNPTNTSAHLWYANVLRARGCGDQARVQILLGLEAEPLSPVLQEVLPGYFSLQEQPKGGSQELEAAIQSAHEAISRDSSIPRRRIHLASLYARQGSWDLVRAELDVARKLGATTHELLRHSAYMYAEAGLTNEVGSILDQLLKLHDEDKTTDYHMDIARVLRLLNDRDRMFQFLNDALKERSPGLPHLNWTEEWADVRADPRAQEILRKMRLLESN